MYAIRSYYASWSTPNQKVGGSNPSGRATPPMPLGPLGLRGISSYPRSAPAVITSYSIHYTKLYETGGTLAGALPGLNPAAGRFDFSDSSDYTGAAKGQGFAGKLGLTYKVAPSLTLGFNYQSQTSLVV